MERGNTLQLLIQIKMLVKEQEPKQKPNQMKESEKLRTKQSEKAKMFGSCDNEEARHEAHDMEHTPEIFDAKESK